ncbi:reticulocalbin-2 isoform X2 [Neocloeon triangulifer]|uniref:reticulocalbin-2 isoform X2 n=1 Tax=Neocloeon triangulifer TaxID=2078957 RepID=UPI00286F8EE5|nr:reticulocalbin-2 isoform X2 [Neocloeon triangulifer]
MNSQIFIFSIIFNLCVAHSVHHHGHHSRGEREEDGAYSPRDTGHFDDAGSHHGEFDHEAILGSVKTAEEFDSLPPEEAKRRLKMLLVKMDRNKDGQIERKELHSWILRSFRMLSEEEAQERFEDIDENKDGKVSWEEHLEDTYGGTIVDDLKQHEPNVKMLKDDKELFDTADKNKDGYLDKNEFPLFSSPEEHPEMHDIILNHTLEDKDTDKDGFVTFQEFVGEKGSHDKEWLLSEKEKFDSEFDKNKDGRLDKAELLSWVVPSDDEIAEEEVVHLFASADDDHDDYLSFDEIIEHHDVFVGSEATDYGDHLHKVHTFPDEL